MTSSPAHGPGGVPGSRRGPLAGTARDTIGLAGWLLSTFAVVGLAGLSLVTSLLGGPPRDDAARGVVAAVDANRRRTTWFTGVATRPVAPVDTDVPGWPLRTCAYELASAPVVSLLVAAAVAWWTAIVVCAVVAIRGTAIEYQPVDILVRIGPDSPSVARAIAFAALGVCGLLLWPFAIRLAPRVERLLTGVLPDPTAEELTREVDRLATTRAEAVSSAEAERRRIERDLHDGFQPQLVNLALQLGLARSRLTSDPEGARELLERAHDDAKRATADLRDLVRGIHPSVLDERGLDAAFSSLAAGSRVPVQIDVHLDRRPSREVEGVAYFVVAEAITNINKHAAASRATVTVTEIDSELRVLVQDDGRGGARPSSDGGLRGLAGRVAGIDGRFSVTSPEGGPTWIEARLPCGS